jgi:hypothetical protein
MSKIEVDAIDKQSGSTLTLGGSGTAVTLACGATQSGFGRNGSVNWQTSIKTGDFTAVNGEGYFIDTSSGQITMTLPSSPSVGDIVALKDYANTFDTNKLTINRNSQPISGDNTVNPEIVIEGQALTLIYGDSTKGWQSVAAATESDLPKPGFIAATGGTVTTVCTNFKVHTFTGPGTFSVSCAGNNAGSNKINYVVVAGGGGGGGSEGGGGGGAGGFREGKASDGGYTASPLAAPDGLTATVASFPITVGAGGAGSPGPGCNEGSQGVSSVFSTITSTGGGGGNQHGTPAPGFPGGSGGGAGARGNAAGGNGNTPPVSPPQGNNGGNSAPGSTPSGIDAGGGGGGAGAVGVNAGNCQGGNGGDGVTTSINSSATARAGGGGGGNEVTPNNPTGGSGGGGNGGFATTVGTAGTVNTGGGGGGSGTNSPGVGLAGGSGIVIIRYKFQ